MRSTCGKSTSAEEKLGSLRLGPSHAVNVVNTEGDIKEKYRERFNGVGLLRDYELKLNIDNSVKPVAQPVGRIPFGVREKVERKLDELLESGIIEEVPEGPTCWVSTLVVIATAGTCTCCAISPVKHWSQRSSLQVTWPDSKPCVATAGTCTVEMPSVTCVVVALLAAGRGEAV